MAPRYFQFRLDLASLLAIQAFRYSGPYAIFFILFFFAILEQYVGAPSSIGIVMDIR